MAGRPATARPGSPARAPWSTTPCGPRPGRLASLCRLGRGGGFRLLLLLDQLGDLPLLLGECALLCTDRLLVLRHRALLGGDLRLRLCVLVLQLGLLHVLNWFSAVWRLATERLRSPVAISLYWVIAPRFLLLPAKIGFCAAAVPSEM